MSAGSAKLLAKKTAENNGHPHQHQATVTNGNGHSGSTNDGVGLLDKYDIGKTIGDGNFAVGI